MKKIEIPETYFFQGKFFTKVFRVMRITAFFLLISVSSVFAKTSYSQNTRFSLHLENVTLQQVFDEIQKKSEFIIFYKDNQVDINHRANIDFDDVTVDQVLDQALKSTNLGYKIIDRQIVITSDKAKEAPTSLSSETLSPQPQKKEINGSVIDAKGIPLPGVSVVVKGTTTGTISDADGKFSLTVPVDAKTLSFSFVGLKTQEFIIGNKTSFAVTLAEETVGLNEVVAVGYGTQKKREVTGSITTVNAEEMKDMPVANFGLKMQGKLSGVQIAATSGEPGSTPSFRIRGQASINGGNAPLFVIDGFPSTWGGIETLSPNEIESVSVLKDASATSLYGSRAANGVILITTKSAKAGVTNIELSAYTGIEKVSNRGKPNMMNAREFAQFKKNIYDDAAIYEGYTGGVPAAYQHPDQVKEGTNWYDVLLRQAITRNYNLSVTAGTTRLKSSVNVNYNSQEGVVLNTVAEKFNIRSNNIFEVTEKLTLGFNLSGTYRKKQIPDNVGNGPFSILGSSVLMDPQLKYRNDDGTYPISYVQPGMFSNANYYSLLKNRKNLANLYSCLINSFAEFEIIKGLKYKLSANLDFDNNLYDSFTPSIVSGGLMGPPPNPATGGYVTGNYSTWMIENTLTYSKTYKKHHFNALLGYTSQKFAAQSTSISATNYPDDKIDWFNVASVKEASGGKSASSMLSYLGRLNYNYDGKYLISMAFRRDGCSRFGADARYGNFPSVSLGWVASDESFLKGYDKLSYLKFRISTGKVGNNNIGDYSSLASVVTQNYVTNGTITAGKALNGIENKNLTWETTQQTDVGFDLGLFKDRIFIVYDYYQKRTDGLLYAIDIPIQSGYSNIVSNIGEFKFWGHEFGLETKNIVGKFKWNTNFNIAFNRNKAIKLGTNNTPIGGYNYYWDYNRTQVGHALGQFIGYVNDGVYMTQEQFDTQPKNSSSMVGSVRMKDVNGPNGKADGVIDEYDRLTVIGDPNPNFVYGMTNEFSYKNFDASIVISGTQGGDIANMLLSWSENLSGIFNVTKDLAHGWRSLENPGDGKIPRSRTGTSDFFSSPANSRHIFDGSFLAVKNVTLGYQMPLKANSYVKSVRFYVSAQNILTLTKYPGMNPEVSAYGLNGLNQGLDQTPYPISIITTLGINIKF